MYRVHLIAVIGLYFFLSTTLFAAEVVIENPAFESGIDAPDGWVPRSRFVGATYLWDAETVHSGIRSVSTHATRYRYGT